MTSGVMIINNVHALGFEEIEQTLQRVAKVQGDTYPPYNIERIISSPDRETKLTITLAVAGFTSDMLSIIQEGRQLIIAGKKAQGEADKSDYLHQGIATRQFQRTFVLAETIEVMTATLKDGLLIIELLRPKPDTIKRNIPIITAQT